MESHGPGRQPEDPFSVFPQYPHGLCLNMACMMVLATCQESPSLSLDSSYSWEACLFPLRTSAMRKRI